MSSFLGRVWSDRGPYPVVLQPIRPWELVYMRGVCRADQAGGSVLCPTPPFISSPQLAPHGFEASLSEKIRSDCRNSPPTPLSHVPIVSSSGCAGP